MTPLSRRTFLLGAGSAVALAACGSAPLASHPPLTETWAALERRYGARLGVHLVDHGTGQTVGYRQDERFPMCSVYKALAAGAIVGPRSAIPQDRLITYTPADLVEYSPVTGAHLATGMTVAQLCSAAVSYSDNTAANLLLDQLGGPPAVTAFARSLGDRITRLDRNEPTVNTAIPGDPRDTTSPRAIATDLGAMVLGAALPASGRADITGWLVANTTGAQSIRAGTPAGWRVGDKTGHGDYGTINDVAVLWPPTGPPLTLAVLTTTATTSGATGDPALVARAAAVALSTVRS